MFKSVLLLTKLQICNIFGLNEAKYAKDKKSKTRVRGTLYAFAVIGLMLVFYGAALSVALASFGYKEIVPLYLTLMSFSIIFGLSVFRAGTIFDAKSYEKLAVLPVSQNAIVASKFLTLYVTNFLFAFVVMVSGAVATCLTVGFDAWFLFSMILSSVFLPLLPITLALVIGTVIYAIVSRFKKNNFLKTALTTIFVVAVIFWPTMMDSNATDSEMIQNLAALFSMVGNVLPPLAWLAAGTSLSGIGWYLLFVVLSVGVFVGYSVLVGRFYKNICSALSSKSANAAFKMSQQSEAKPIWALYKREFKRYTSSSIYFLNTCMGNILTIVLSVSILFTGIESIYMELGIPTSVVTAISPFLIAVTNCLMSITACAISMEGKGWEQTKALPVSAKTVMDAKLLLQYTFSLPVSLISSTLFSIASSANGLEIVWLFVIPLALSITLGAVSLFVNAKYPCLTWDNANVPVKQSSSTLICMLISMVIVIASGVLVGVAGESYSSLVSLLLVMAYVAIFTIVYKKLSTLRLNEIDEK